MWHEGRRHRAIVLIALCGWRVGPVFGDDAPRAADRSLFVQGGSVVITSRTADAPAKGAASDAPQDGQMQVEVFAVLPGDELVMGENPDQPEMSGVLRVTPIEGRTSSGSPRSEWTIELGDRTIARKDGLRRTSPSTLVLDAAKIAIDETDGRVHLAAVNVLVPDGWAARLTNQSASKLLTVDVLIQLDIDPADAPAASLREGVAESNGSVAGAIGPDVIVKNLQLMESYGTAFDTSAQKLRTAFAVATTSCNLGDEPAVWYSGSTGTPPGFGNQHPVIAQNMFRLHNSRFEQIGMAWLKHGFFATQQTACGQCTNPFPEGNDGYLLGVGCSDPYSTSLNGQQTNLGPRSEVNGFTGNFPFPFTGRGQNPTNILQKRLLVDDTDVDPNLFPGAQYFVEGHYVTPDDAQEGNGNNNSAYRPITRSTPVPGGICRFLDPENPNERCFTVTGFTRLNPAIYAWREADASVQITEIDVPEMVDPGPMGFMLIGAKSIDLGNGFWRYEYALQNVNSHRSAGSFRVPLPTGAIVQNAGFHDVFYHSGEENLYDPTDWSVTVTLEQVIWATTPFSVNPNANALRWSTMYNFRFDANVAPQPANVVVGLFRPVVGLTDALSVNSIGPAAGIVDCNSNGIPDACDLSCGAPGCVPPCGDSDDCNLNSVPDDCESDCNNNGVADLCDIGNATSHDCDFNDVPDECQPDCDGDGVIDTCELITDTDSDGVDDCDDLCPATTPVDGCRCPVNDRCCFPAGICIPNFPRESCIELGGTPDCLSSPCRGGCFVGDYNGDGVRDLADFVGVQLCFGKDHDAPGFVAPSDECLRLMDYEGDGDVDIADYFRWKAEFTGPPTE